MTRSLTTGITGLRTHQQNLDIVANNLANANTVAFKAQTVTFSDLIYQNLGGGGGGGETEVQAIGTGAQVARISRRFSQGQLESTGEIFDFALQGEGYFILTSASGETVYTRDGSFGLDSEGRLIDPSSGFTVRRFGTVGDPSDTSAGFQEVGDDSIKIPLGVAIPGSATTTIDFSGNLPSTASPPAAQVISSFGTFQGPTGPATAATLLNDLTVNDADYVLGDTIQINGTNPDGTGFIGTIPADTATLGDLVTAVNALSTGATASILPDGTFQMAADDTGVASMTLVFSDSTGNVGSTNFSGTSMIETVAGTDGDVFQSSMEIFDTRGETHRLAIEFRKVTKNSWDAVASIDGDTGSMIDDSVFNITFNENGTFALAGTSGIGDSDIEIALDALSGTQVINVGFQELSHLATDYSLNQSPDGFPSGTLVSVAVSEDGELSGLASNGRTVPIAQLAIARFRHAGALNPIGNNHFQQTLNAGTPSVGDGNSGGRGSIVSGQLENSNVDIAQEFTRLIVAQRGFSANARTITVADEMLEELTNIIR